MIGEIAVDAKLTIAKANVSSLYNNTLGQDGISINLTGKYHLKDLRKVTTSDGTIPLGDLSAIGWICLVNTGSSLINTPGAPTVAVIGVAGAATYTYALVAKQANGNSTVAGATGTTSTGNATLSSTNLNRLTWTAVDNATSYDVYRTVGGAATGKIGNVATTTIDDTGLTADGTTAPATTPFNFDIGIGYDGTNYPLLLKGGDTHVFRFNSSTVSAVHHKALFNGVDMAFLVVEP